MPVRGSKKPFFVLKELNILSSTPLGSKRNISIHNLEFMCDSLARSLNDGYFNYCLKEFTWRST